MTKKIDCPNREWGRLYWSEEKVQGCRKHGNVCFPDSDCIEEKPEK